MINVSGWQRPRRLGFACSLGSLLLGFVYLAAAGAPAHYLLVNFLALSLGVCLLMGLKHTQRLGHTVRDLAMLVLSMTLLLTALFGQEAHGASRWIAIGPLQIQPSFVLVPSILVYFSARPNSVTTSTVLIAALALALQPDRGMAGAMTFALIALAVLSVNRFVLIAVAASAAAFLVTLARPDDLPAMPHVEQVLFSALEVHPLVGIAVIFGSVLLLVPGVAGFFATGVERTMCFAVASTWFALIMAAVLGNYPTPVVRYSGAAVLGYVFSVGCLPDETRT